MILAASPLLPGRPEAPTAVQAEASSADGSAMAHP